MSTHIVGLHRPADMRLRDPISFRATSEHKARVPFGASGDAPREAWLVRCQHGAPLRCGADCQACPRFLDWHNAPDGLYVRCSWSHRDRVRDCMTIAGALMFTHPRATCREAARLAQGHQVRRLLVADGLRLVGIVSQRDLRAGGQVRDRMSRDIFTIASSATLGEALAAMVALDVGMLPVIGQCFVIGVITRGDLRRVGVPPELFHSRRSPPAEARIPAASGASGPPPLAIDDDSDMVLLPDDTPF